MQFVLREVNTSLEAFDILTLFKEEKNLIFLDSAMKEGELGQYSFIGLNPFLTYKSCDGKIYIDNSKVEGDIFEKLEEILNQYKLELEDVNLPFVGGGIGYFSYDAGRTIESLPDTARKDIHIPEVYFNFYDNLIIFDHIKNKTYISALGILDEGDRTIDKILEAINTGKKVEYEEIKQKETKFYSNFTKEEYIESVYKLRQYIRSGDVYIANMTQRFSCDSTEDSYEIYKNLRNINPAPFASFMKLEDFEVISSSPERFLKIINNKAVTRPIKGTRPRGKDQIEDEINKKELLNSEKDKSELLMIVDLERNDLSKVCKAGSVKVSELFKLESYSTVFHLVSTVEGELEDGISAVKCIRECFPGGSITGAPKIRAMEIIEELEALRRNIYTGAIGYFDLRGNADFNIVIRTILKKGNKAYFGVGGGVTWESEEEAEYNETLDKAKALMKVL